MHEIGFLILISCSYSKGVSARHKLNKIHLFGHLFHWDLLHAMLCLVRWYYYLLQHASELGISRESLLKLVQLVCCSFLAKL